MLSRIIKIGLICLILLGILYFGACVYDNFFGKHTLAGAVEMPDAIEAAYSLTIKNTGGLIFTSKYEEFGEKPGERIYVLHGYWELIGQEFRYHERDLIMNEQIFGEIILKRRS